MKKISNYIFEHKGKYLLAITSMIIAVTLDLMSPQFTKHIIDDVIVGKNIAELKHCFKIIEINPFTFPYI